MAKAQSRTVFFKSIIEDKNVPSAHVKIFFRQAYEENGGHPAEQLRLLDLLTRHRPELESAVASNIIRG